MARATIPVEGLQELLWGLQRLDEEVSREIPAGLRAIARGVASTAREIAAEKGLRDDLHAPDGGGLISQIRHSVRGTTAYVVSKAARVSRAYPEGFPYPAVYEYGGSELRATHGKLAKITNRSRIGGALVSGYGAGSGHLGPRAFLEPAIEQDSAQIEADLEAIIAHALTAAGF